MDINQVLKSTESTRIEFKERINKSLFQTISAFANREGGEIYIGINDKKELKGFKLNNEELTILTNRIVNKLGIHPQIEHLKIKDKDILRILVNKSDLPISY